MEEIIFKQIVDKILDAIILVDKNAKIIYANPAVRLFGYETSELIGKSILDFIPKKYLEYVLELIKLYTEGKRDYSRIEIEIPEKNGNLRWTDVVISRIDDSTAAIEIRDISEIKRLLKELEESRETYRTIFEAYPDFLSIVDSEGKIIAINRNFLKRYSLDEKRLLGSSILYFVHPTELERAKSLLKNAVESRKIVRDALKVAIRDEELIVDISMRFVRVGERIFGIIVGKDITEKAKLEMEIRKREELYSEIINSSLTGFLLVEDGKIIFTNNTASKITGYTKMELIGMSVDNLLEPEDLDNFRKSVEEILKGKKLETVSRFRKKDGSRGYARILANLMEYEDRKLILVSFEDISEKRRIEKKLEEKNILYRTLVENSHTGIFIIQNNKIVYANRILAQLLGYTMEEINNFQHPYEIIAPEFRDVAVNRYLAREKGMDVPESYEVKVRTKNGEEKWLKVLATRIKYKGAPAVMVNLADITKIKKDEEVLKRMNALLTVAGEIKGMLIEETSEQRIFSKLKSSLEKLDAEVGIYSVSKSIGTVSLGNLNIDLSNKINLKDVLQEFHNGKWLTFVPIFHNGLQNIVVIARNQKFTDDELRIVSTISHDLSLRFKAIKIEKEKDMVMKIITDNLSHFENLADKLRNPLAVIKGCLEIRDEIPEKEFIMKISEYTQRIERLLDELRFRELETYEMKKTLENRRFS
ncbi:MAG: PAS domain S-box protein [Archaeoglobaceae archaeon]|nr:PAS domain S-box protein [Archaeoglobaceae archaeon]